jgi:hypothetical protein
MYEAGIEVTDTDFEFAKPPLSKKFLCLVFEKYQLDFIAYFGENMFYITGQNSEPLVPLYPDAGYPEDLELVLDFMARERIRRLRYEKGVLFRSAIPFLSDSKVQ